MVTGRHNNNAPIHSSPLRRKVPLPPWPLKGSSGRARKIPFDAESPFLVRKGGDGRLMVSGCRLAGARQQLLIGRCQPVGLFYSQRAAQDVQWAQRESWAFPSSADTSGSSRQYQQHPPSGMLGPPPRRVPAEGGPNILSSSSLGAEGAEAKFLAVSLKHWARDPLQLWGGGGGLQACSPPPLIGLSGLGPPR